MNNSKLKEIRQALKLSQKDFSEKLGIKQSYYSALELGKKDISTSKVLQTLFDRIGVNPEWYYNSNGVIFNEANVYIRRGKAGVEIMESLKNRSFSEPSLPNYPGNMDYSNLHKFKDFLDKTHPEYNQLGRDIISILSMGDITTPLHDSKIGDPIFFGVSNIRKGKSFKEFKDIGLQAYSDAYMHHEIINEYAEACRKFVIELSKIKGEIGLDFDFEDWLG